MIYTCTLNPAIDYKITIDQLVIGELNRFKDGQFLVGGKGINVSIALKKLGLPTTVTGFIGGVTGKQIKQEVKHILQLKSEFIEVDALTRVNVKVLIDDKETEINHDGYEIELKAVSALLNKIKQLKTSDLLVCGGSTAKGHPKLYAEIAKVCRDKKIEFVMDTTGDYLEQVLKYQPLLVKPNLYELESFFKKSIQSDEDIIHYGKKLIESGAKHVIVSLGKSGSYLITKDKVYRANPITGVVKNTVGAGDSMVAGFIYGYKKHLDLNESYKYAVAAATATTFGSEIMDLEAFNTYYNQVHIEEIV